jgi:hypothetical protein
MNKCTPDFFIVGAPKCGTTSLAAWLAEHPAICMARPKEPSYFDSDSPHVGVRRLNHYLRCFEHARPEHLAVGDASPNYLISAVAVPEILRFRPDARIIVALRDPVSMAPSLHAQLFYNHHEDHAEFTTAWRAQARRRAGEDIPPNCRLPQFLQYARACALGSQLARVYEHVDRKRVCVVMLDDLKADARREYLRVLGFLGVPDDGRAHFPVHNSGGALAQRRSWLPGREFGYFKQRVGLAHLSFKGWLGEPVLVVDTAMSRPPIDAELHQELVATLDPEVELLERLLGRDLRNLWGRALPSRLGVANVS